MSVRLTGRKERGFTLVELMIVIAVLGIVSAMAIPNYLRYQMKSRQTEAKSNLGGIFIAETSFFGDQSAFGTFVQIGFTVAGAGNSRYAYRVGAGTTNGVDLLVPAIGTDPGGNSIVPAAIGPAGFTATATANLDSDPAIDMWHVNDLKQNLQSADNSDVS